MRTLWIAAVSLAALLSMPGLPSPASAQVDSREGIALQNQMYQLRQELQTLRDQFGRGGGGGSSRPATGGSSSGNDMVAQLLTRLDALDDQVRQLRGRIDEVQNHAQRQNADLGKRVDDLAYQMNNRSAADAPAGKPMGTVPPLSVPAELPTQPRVRTPEAAMQEGNAALARRDYPAAEAAAKEVVATKASPRAYDGQMLLGQALFGQRKYSESAIAFDDTYKRNRKGARAQDALLGLTNSLTGLGEKKAACATLDKLYAEFPQPRADLKDGLAGAAQRAGCR
jgi:TolA-binding protein